MQEINKLLPTECDYGECWELSAHALHISKIADGPWYGTSLQTIVEKHGDELLGGNYSDDRFPLLVKYLDCNQLLSVQVHPTDELAQEIIGNESGKTEAWVVLKTMPDAKIYAGLKPGVEYSDLKEALAAGTVVDCLHSFTPTPGDCIWIPAGTVHAMGGGILIAEIQQTSDATFRLFDWNRLDANGRLRPLHVNESLRCIDWSAGPVAPVIPTRFLGLSRGVIGENLVDCPFFTLQRMQLSQQWTQRISTWWIAMVIEGEVELTTGIPDDRRILSAGQTALIPASSGECHWTPYKKSTLLLATA